VARIGRLSTKGSVLLLCDIQEKFRPNIFQFTNIVSNAARLLQVQSAPSMFGYNLQISHNEAVFDNI